MSISWKSAVLIAIATTLAVIAAASSAPVDRWSVEALTYKITKYSKHLDRATVDNEIRRAFAVWGEYTDLSFTARTLGTVDIEISFDEDFDCGVLAYAFSPAYGGGAHFNNDEHWTIRTRNGPNLFQVAVHTFGESLGLSHSDVESSVMSPYHHSQYKPDFKLDSVDVQAIQALYGRKTVV